MSLEKSYFLEITRQGDESAARRAYMHWGMVMANAPDYSREEEAGRRQDAAEKAMHARVSMRAGRRVQIEEYGWQNP